MIANESSFYAPSHSSFLLCNASLITTKRVTKSFISYQLRKRKTSIGCLPWSREQWDAAGLSLYRTGLNPSVVRQIGLLSPLSPYAGEKRFLCQRYLDPFQPFFVYTHTHTLMPDLLSHFSSTIHTPQDLSSFLSLNHTRRTQSKILTCYTYIPVNVTNPEC